ncbi:MAG TPA: biotin--[acetyl-CoA-carboxylase] ligase [Ferruginibacter sp.]|nr:biotin--[acetyl-CoA-carboxylase] ligase [Ferruginibacter sp.]HRE64240.1 biotin--[acetyl-CoA-carboxylase] ligase [Ferruginibacter sp.]
MEKVQLFNILDSVDSTNNYAMARINEGLAEHGMAWFAREQTSGKGQRGKKWQSEPDNNIILSITVKPSPAFISNPFYLSALVATTCNDFLQKITGENFYIKWPNDLFWRDRKTGGILIENKFSGDSWNWAVVGIGINVNQIMFGGELARAASLKQVSGKDQYEPVKLARELHEFLLEKINCVTEKGFAALINEYNNNLYKKNNEAKLKKENAVFSTIIKEVNHFGQLVTNDTIERIFDFGEVQWVVEAE